MSLRTRILSLIGVFLLLVVGIGSWGVWSTVRVQEKILVEHQRISEAELCVLLAEVVFERQILVWSKLLLRGHESGDLELYWEEFIEEEANTQRQMELLVAMLPEGSGTGNMAEIFLQEHRILGEDYREALVVFKVGGAGAQIRGDGLVRGRDEKLSSLFGEMAKRLRVERDAMQRSVSEVTLRRSVATSVAILSAALVAFVVLALALNRWMDLPLLSVNRGDGKHGDEEAGKGGGDSPVRFKAPRKLLDQAPALAPASKKRILAVGLDATRVRELESCGWEVMVAATASSAMRCLALDGHGGTAAPVALIVLGSEMRGRGGRTLARVLRAEATTCATPLVWMVEEGGGAELAAEEGMVTLSLSGKSGERKEELRALTSASRGRGQELVPIDFLQEFGRTRGSRILVAEDDALNRKYMGLMLEKVGLEFAMVENGAEALRAMEEESYEVVLMDGSMPVMDGYEATRRIRALVPEEGGGGPVIVGVTAHADDAAEEQTREAGMDAWVTKPVKLEYLCLMLEELLARKEAG